MPTKAPWAILLCRYSDDQNDPSTTLISDLYSQWGKAKGAAWLAGALNSAAATDSRTILDLYETFFTITGLFTFNMVRYFDEMSHGLLDITDSRVFPCVLDLTTAESDASAISQAGQPHQDDLFARAKKALTDQHGVDWRNYSGGVVVSFQAADTGGSQGGQFDGGPGAIGDIRWVLNDGSAKWGHEMGHGFGLGHSRTDGELTSACTGGAPSDYTDNWDVMSFACCQFASDGSYGATGPGLNAWNMRSRGWLDESRVWKSAGDNFSERIELRPLHQRNYPGYLCAEVPGVGGDSAYLIEFRVPEDWDAAFSAPAVIVHRYATPNSYIMKGTAGQKILSAGGVFEKGLGPFSRLEVESIDATNRIATVLLCHGNGAKIARKVTLRSAGHGGIYSVDRCHPKNIAGTAAWFDFHLDGSCMGTYTVQWIVEGAIITSTLSPNSSLVQVLLPPAGETVVVTVKVTFNDGVSVFDTTSFQTILQDQANWTSMLCRLLDDARLKPIPWWRWDHEKLDPITHLTKAQLETAISRLEGIVKTLHKLQSTKVPLTLMLRAGETTGVDPTETPAAPDPSRPS